MEKKLFVRNPKINCYTPYGILFSILPKSMELWVYNNFIQLIYSQEWKIYAFAGHQLLINRCPALDYYKYPDSFVISRNILKEQIKHSIDDDMYLLVWVDRYFLPMASEYMKWHHPHELFIYGYNDIENLVYIADNLQDGKYIYTSCSFSDIDLGHFSLNDNFDFRNIQLFKLNDKVDYPLDIEQITYSLQCFLASQKFFYINKEHDMQYGIKLFDKLINDIENGNVDIRVFHLLYEHLYIMVRRVNYLLKKGFLYNKGINISIYEFMRNEMLNLRNFVIKCILKNEVDTGRIVERIQIIKTLEEKEFNKLLNELTYKCK